MSLNPPDRRLRVLLCGYGHLGLALLQGLLECAEHCEVIGVFRWSSRPSSANCWEPVEGTFQNLIEQAGLKDLRCDGLNTYEFTCILQELQPDVVLIGSWGEIIKRHLIEHPNLMLINCHPSKLPAHRGANPYATVILHRETETGVTFHRMAPKIDAGAILLQRSVPLAEEENGSTVRDKCAATANEMVPELIQRLKAHFIEGQPLEEVEQNHALKTYYPQLKPEDGLLNWSETPEALCRQMRALFPWIACYSYLQGKRTVMFYDPNFVPAQTNGQANESLPGTILANQKGKIIVSLSNPEWVLEVTSYQFARGHTPWPLWLSHLLAPFLLRPGQRFMNSSKAVVANDQSLLLPEK